MFCYGYYVKPRPETPGKIIIRKVLNQPGAPPTTFQFESNASFTGDNLFTLAPRGDSPASITFERASGQVWTFEELIPLLGDPDPDPTCVSQVGNSTFTDGPGEPGEDLRAPRRGRHGHLHVHEHPGDDAQRPVHP